MTRRPERAHPYASNSRSQQPRSSLERSSVISTSPRNLHQVGGNQSTQQSALSVNQQSPSIPKVIDGPTSSRSTSVDSSWSGATANMMNSDSDDELIHALDEIEDNLHLKNNPQKTTANALANVSLNLQNSPVVIEIESADDDNDLWLIDMEKEDFESRSRQAQLPSAPVPSEDPLEVLVLPEIDIPNDSPENDVQRCENCDEILAEDDDVYCQNCSVIRCFACGELVEIFSICVHCGYDNDEDNLPDSDSSDDDSSDFENSPDLEIPAEIPTQPPKTYNHLCQICITHEVDSICLPCGHFCICQICIDKLRRDECPMCRTKIESFKKVFF